MSDATRCTRTRARLKRGSWNFIELGPTPTSRRGEHFTRPMTSKDGRRRRRKRRTASERCDEGHGPSKPYRAAITNRRTRATRIGTSGAHSHTVERAAEAPHSSQSHVARESTVIASQDCNPERGGNASWEVPHAIDPQPPLRDLVWYAPPTSARERLIRCPRRRSARRRA